MLNRAQAPTIKSPVHFDFRLLPLETHTLNNGLTLYAVRDHIEPVFQLEWVFQAGSWFEPAFGVAMATLGLLKSGTPNKTSFQINEFIEQRGATLKAGAGPDWASVQLSGLTRHLPELLPLVMELITETIYPQHELDLYIQNAKERLRVQLKKGDFIANRKIDEYLFGLQHPYGRYMQADNFDALHRETLIAYRQQFLSAANARLFLAGQCSDADIQAINQAVGQQHWGGSTAIEQPVHPVLPATEKKYRITNDENSVQGAIRMAAPFPEKTHPDFTPMIVLNTLLGGYFGSRLMSNIREEKGYTYGIHSYLYNNRHLGALLITTEAGKDVSEACVSEIYKEMALLRDTPVDAEELDLVKNYLLGSIMGDLDGSFQNIQRWKNLILNGFTEERFYNNIRIYKTIDAQELQRLANEYLVAERFYELIVT